jgi:branched-chain amino acid transport system ATP-binding protein
MNKIESLLHVDGVCAGYGAIPVLYDVSFAIGAGESVGILGHNGMGKTTLLRTLIGALPATQGAVTFSGVDVTGFAPNQRSRKGMAYVPQGRGIFSALSVYDNLRLGIYKTGRDATTVTESLLEDFPRLKPLLDRAGGALSGGEQQLLALARALAGNPALLLLDEPTEGIQPSIIDEIADTLVKLQERSGLTILLVEQNIDFITAVSERVMVVRRGQIVGEIPRDQLSDIELVSRYAGGH